LDYLLARGFCDAQKGPARLQLSWLSLANDLLTFDSWQTCGERTLVVLSGEPYLSYSRYEIDRELISANGQILHPADHLGLVVA
jgi:hypothetical protein